MLTQQLAFAQGEAARLFNERELLEAQHAHDASALRARVEHLRNLRQATLAGDPEKRIQDVLESVRAM